MSDSDSQHDSVRERIRTTRRRVLQATGGVATAAAVADTVGAQSENGGSGGHSSRVNKLVAKMTLEEKVGQMTQMNVGSLDPAEVGDLFTEHHVGSLLSGGASPPTHDPTELAEQMNALQEWVVNNTRLGIPFVFGVDAVHGNATVYDAPVFPHNLALGATWDPDLSKRLAEITGQSVRASGAHWNFAPANDIQRDPRWGRFYEGFSESVHLSRELDGAKVEGYESSTDEYDLAVGACQKHFAGYSEPNNGNDRNAAHLPMRYFRDTILPPYEVGIDAGVETVMVNSGSVNGVPAHASEWLLTTVLREEMGFEGMVVSDWKDFKRMVTIHNYAPDLREATKLGVNAGVDMYMNPDDPAEFTSILQDLVESGEVKRSRIDEAVRRILTFKENLGLFDDPYVDPSQVDSKVKGAGREEAATAAREAMTLLQNDDTLPLDPGLDEVLVTGVRIDHPLNQMGGWTLGWQGLDVENVDLDRVPAVTILEGVEAAVSEGTTVTAEPISHEWDVYGGPDEYSFDDEEAVESAAERADAAIVVVGEGPHSEGPGDIDELALHEAQQRLVETVAGTDVPTVGVVVAGRPRGTEVFDQFDASLMAYQSGTATGTAVAETVFGSLNPGGHLPFRWPEVTGQVVNVHNELHPNDNEPRFEFGHGLSYTSFGYADLQVMPSPETLNVSVSVTNEGSRAGDEVVQVFATRDGAPVIYPEKILVGFERVSLEPGETKRVEIEAPLSTLAVVPGDMPGDADERVVPAGEYELWVADQETSFTLESRRKR